jgi:hypothetical protein
VKARRPQLAARVPVSYLNTGDYCVLPLPQGDTLCDIRRIVRPGASTVVMIDYRTPEGTTGTHSLLSTDVVLRVRTNGAVAA